MREVSLDLEAGFRLAHWDVRPRRLTAVAGQRTVRLEPRVMDVLVCLARHGDEVVTRSEFIREVWDGRVVSDEVLSRCISLLRAQLDDDPRAPRLIETLPKIGYRLINPVEPLDTVAAPSRVESDTHPDGAIGATPTASLRVPRRRRAAPWLFGALAAACVLAIGVSLRNARGDLSLAVAPASGASQRSPTAPSVAVLPFVNISPDPENEYFADGLSEELLNTLAGIRGVRVVGHTSSFYFKGRNDPVAVIGRTLHVNHLLEGSVRRSGAHIRITAQLLDAETGYHLWSQVYDRDIGDVLAIQEEIARSVADALQVKLLGEDELRLDARPTRDAEAYRLYLEARARADSGEVRDLFAAKAQLEEVVGRDPNFASAHADLAGVIAELIVITDRLDLADQGRAAAARAMTLDPQLSGAYVARGEFVSLDYWWHGNVDAHAQALSDYRRAIELDPANSWAYTVYGYETFPDDPVLAQQMYERSLVIDPLQRDSELQLAVIFRHLGRYDEARKTLRRMIDFYSGYSRGYVALAQVERFSGRLDEAVKLLRGNSTHDGAPDYSEAFYLWSTEMDLGDTTAASAALVGVRGAPWIDALREATRASMGANYRQAFESLERGRRTDPEGCLATPAAHAALIVGEAGRAAAILQERFPDLATGRQPINALNAAPALDLAAALLQLKQSDQALQLLERVATFLDVPKAPHGPPATILRAQVDALRGDLEPALGALETAYATGFRTLWAVSMVPGDLYLPFPIDADPRFGALRNDPRFAVWLSRIRNANAQQLARLQSIKQEHAGA